MSRHAMVKATGTTPRILDKTAYLDIDEWMFVSIRATKLRNMPVFIKTENNEETLLHHFRGELARSLKGLCSESSLESAKKDEV